MTSKTSIQTVGVLGAGQMGAGIAQVAASVGCLSVSVFDINESALAKANEKMQASLEKLIGKGKLEEKSEDILARVSWTTHLKDLAACDFVIEAVVEKLQVKAELFKKLDELLGDQAILASNTSSIPITKLAAETKRSDRVVGMHFMNPVPIMKLVEIIRSPMTSDSTYTTTVALAEQMQKSTVCSQDYAGFIVNRILMPMLNEACFTLFEGVASAKDIDTAMQLGTNQPMGPLALADFIGLDTCLYILEVMHQDFGDPKFRPCPLLRQYVSAGRLGCKTGRGFYQYES